MMIAASSLLPHPSSLPAIIAAVQASAVLGPTLKLDRANAISNAFVCAPPTFLPLQDIPQQELQIIKNAFCDAYGITKLPIAGNTLPLLLQQPMVLLHATADGKSLVPLTTSMIRNGVILVLVPLHRLGSDQVDKQLFSIMVLKPIISMSTRKSMHKSEKTVCRHICRTSPTTRP
jgi:hypothetical protein